MWLWSSWRAGDGDVGIFTLLKHLHPPPLALPPVCGVFQAIHSVAWHHEGKQFICSHSDGTLTIWNVRGQGKPVQTITPHGKAHARQTCTKRQLCRRGNCVVSCHVGNIVTSITLRRRLRLFYQRHCGEAGSALLMMPFFMCAPLPQDASSLPGGGLCGMKPDGGSTEEIKAVTKAKMDFWPVFQAALACGAL